MTSKLIRTFFIFVLLTGCSSETFNVSESVSTEMQKTISKDTMVIEIKSKLSGIDLFIDSMKSENYIIDTNRLKQVTWSFLAKYPKNKDNGHTVIQVPFPVDGYQHHFNNPKTYFFASWNEKEKTFKNGNDYLLMTWTIDNAGIVKEKEIYNSLHRKMGNFPCYIFRSKNIVYSVSHRMTVRATQTKKLTENLRSYIDSTSILYRPFDGKEPR